MHLLTDKICRGNLYPLSRKTKAGIGLLNVAAQPHQCGFFVPNAQLSFMAGWAEQPSGWPVATPVDQLRSVCLPMIGLVWRRVFNLTSGVAIMNNHAQNPAKSQPKTHQSFALNKPLPPVKHRRKAFFNLVDYQNQAPVILFSGLDFYQALALLPCHPFSRLKFDRMEVMQ